MKSTRSGTGERGISHALTAALAVTLAAAANAQAPTPLPLPLPVPEASTPVFIDPVPAAPPFGAPVPIGTTGTSIGPPAALPLPLPTAAPFGIAGPSGTSMRDVFMGTLAVAAQATGASVITGLTQLVTGGISDWFNRKAAEKAARQQASVASTGAGTIPVVAPGPTSLPLPAATTAAMPARYPADAGAGLPAPISQGAPVPLPVAQVPFFDPQTGFATSAEPAVLAAASPAGGGAGDLFAGLAYEVHMVGVGGATIPVNPATHEFHTGDRFVVLYRPTLPGRMDVYNINPAGRQTQIDRTEIAGGQLARLGPYEFSAMTGNEQLRLVLSPCSTPALAVATRDIVNVSNAPTSSGFDLADCATLVTRSTATVATRDIRKVAMEGATGFALDPVSAPERASGRLAPRELTISFRHR